MRTPQEVGGCFDCTGERSRGAGGLLRRFLENGATTYVGIEGVRVVTVADYGVDLMNVINYKQMQGSTILRY